MASFVPVSDARPAYLPENSGEYLLQPFGPRGDRYVWAGHSCRRDGGGQERIGSKFTFASLSWDGRQLGSLTVQAWASPLACPLR